jgi:beta-lactamase class A
MARPREAGDKAGIPRRRIDMPIARRGLLLGALLAPAAALAEEQDALAAACRAIEARHGGRLGAAILDGARDMPLTWRGGERFPICSTYKLLAAAGVLARVDRGAESLDRRVVFGRQALVTYSPATGPQAGPPGMTLAAICEAAITLSDNTAGNLLLEAQGGPAGLTAWLRGIGDAETRLDRTEPTLNEAAPGDPRDTTTPAAMVRTMRALLLGPALAPASRDRLAAWLVACRTGDARIRAGVPPGWRAGDKTGTGERHATADVAILWPPGRAPVLVAAYYAESPASDADRNAALAAIGRLAAG